ncbi:alpha/beta fold hydrolase [Shewanella polaris]|uniref:Alpha/beta hydrolase n=1 Tax=Shewanella polaris TaxID=2588449 RepID=A0A4Y5YI20_9GAMM|nr:alpha/beta hydrolase [Shewanella polaris]QDE32344.1 alpha/beta hydrolase [Shewanella polaris]
MTTWVLLRGLMRDSRHWYGFDRLIQQQGINLICVDLPGNGRLAQQASPLSIDQYCDSVWQQIDAAMLESPELNSPLMLVGLSMGGMLALQMAAHRPQSVKQVVVINSSAANISTWYRRFQLAPLLVCSVKALWGAMGDLMSDLRGNNPHKSHVHIIESIVLKYTSRNQCNNIEVLQAWSVMRQQQHTSFSSGLRQLYACAGFNCPILPRIAVSVIVANQDQLAHPKCSDNLAVFYQTQLHKIDNCGHDASLDQPKELLELLQQIAKT